MANTFDKFLTTLSNKIKSVSKSKFSVSTPKSGYLDRAAGVKKKSETLKSLLTTFNKTAAEPTAKTIESVMFKKKTDWQSPLKKIADRKKSLIRDVNTDTISAPGSFFTAPTISEQQKNENIEFLRTGKIKNQIEEMKKEWIMEETKKKRDATGGSNLTYEQASQLDRYTGIISEAEAKWKKLYETDKDSVVPSIEKALAEQTKQSLLDDAQKKESWIESQVPLAATGWSKLANQFVSASDLRATFPDWYAKKEEEYASVQKVQAYVGFGIKAFDKDLENLLGKDKIAQMEVRQALMNATDPKKILTSMTLDIVNFEDIASIGQDVYTKDGKIYYRGFEVDDEYLTDEGKQAALVTNTIARFAGGIVPYAGISNVIKTGVFSIAQAKDLPRILSGIQKLSQGVMWSSKAAPILTEMTVSIPWKK